MPELPEVETVRAYLDGAVKGERIASVVLRNPKMFKNFAPASLEGARIEGVSRRGKHLLVALDGKRTLVSHLRMEGRYELREPRAPDRKHDHVVFVLADGRQLVYNDVRAFGTFHLYANADLAGSSPLRDLAIDPLDPMFGAAFVKKAFAGSRRPVKAVLLDQTAMAGIGNIYADEILFAARVLPTRLAGSLSSAECAAVAKAAKATMKLAVKHRGTTIRTYHFDGKNTGGFQKLLKVHTRAGKPCLRCGALVEKTRVAGRGTYVCGRCQG